MKFLRWWLTSFMGLAFTSSVFADTPAKQFSYQKVAPGEKFVFVMIAPVSVEEDAASFWKEEMAASIRAIRSKYTQSGMYLNDGSAEPIWTVDWYANGVQLTADGIHLTRPGPWAWLNENKSPDLDCEAVSFFANGKLLKTYRVNELVDNPGRFTRSVSHYEWRQEGSQSGELEYTIITLDGNRFTFDLRTGDTISSMRMGHIHRWGWWVALGLVTGIGAVWIILIRKSRSRKLETLQGKSSP